MTHPLDSNDSAQLATMHLHTARNIKRLITVNPQMYDTPKRREALADQVLLARLHNRKAVRDLRDARKAETDDDPRCVCGVYRSEHALCGCEEGFVTPEQWQRRLEALTPRYEHERDYH